MIIPGEQLSERSPDTSASVVRRRRTPIDLIQRSQKQRLTSCYPCEFWKFPICLFGPYRLPFSTPMDVQPDISSPKWTKESAPCLMGITKTREQRRGSRRHKVALFDVAASDTDTTKNMVSSRLEHGSGVRTFTNRNERSSYHLAIIARPERPKPTLKVNLLIQIRYE